MNILEQISLEQNAVYMDGFMFGLFFGFCAGFLFALILFSSLLSHFRSNVP